MRTTHVVSFLALLTVVALTIAGCRPQSPPIQPYPGPVSCEPSPADATHPCIACLKSSCCAEFKACDRDSFPPGTPTRAAAAECFCMLVCQKARKRPFDDCVARCGAVTNTYTAVSACWDEHCDDACRGGGS